MKMKPSEFDLCDPEDDLTIMLAFLMARGKMTDYEQRQAEKQRKRKGLFGKR